MGGWGGVGCREEVVSVRAGGHIMCILFFFPFRPRSLWLAPFCFSSGLTRTYSWVLCCVVVKVDRVLCGVFACGACSLYFFVCLLDGWCFLCVRIFLKVALVLETLD